MKGFLATLKGKIIAGVASVLVVTGVATTVVLINSPDEYRSIKVEELTGQVVISDENSKTQDAYKGMNLESGDYITVQEYSNMTLLFDADKYMFADAGTKFAVEASGNSEKSNTKTRIILDEGSVLCRLDSKLSDEEVYEVETPNSVMSVRGTIFKMTIYQDENGENYTRVDVLEGSVKVDLYKENGEKAGDEGLIKAGQAALVHSNTDVSEFVIGDSDITYNDFSGPMAEFVVSTIDNGREICIGESLFKHYTGLENHPEEERIVKEATATEDGEKEIYCPTCDAVIRVEAIPATGEIETTEEKEEVEETQQTQKEEPAKETETTPSTTTLSTSTSTPSTEESQEPEHTHSYGDWAVTSSASCIKAGVETRICSGCGTTETQEIAALGHSYGNWVVTTAATCTDAGEETRTCSGCGGTQTQTIEATGHSYGAWEETTAATCTDAGEETRTCSGCGGTQTQAIEATGHSYGAWEETTAATCTDAGEETRTCSGCGGTQTQVIEATGHSFPEHTASDWHNFDVWDKEAGTVSVFSYRNCEICGVEEIFRETGTITSYSDSYDQPTGFECPCGYVY